MTGRFFIRADCSRGVGLGHLMRGVALSEAARRRDLSPQLLVDQHIPSTLLAALGEARVVRTDDEWHDEVTPRDVVIFDGYKFGPADHLAVRQRGARVAAMDDHGRGDYQVDVLINQNIVRSPQFQIPDHTKVLLGPDYALIRREFLCYRRKRGAMAKQLIITMGGSDAARLTNSVVRIALDEGHFEHVRVLQGPATAECDLPVGVSIARNPESVAVELDSSDVVVSAAGVTTWELLCMGLPSTLIEIAENQRHVGRAVAERGAALFAGSLPLDAERLRTCLRELASSEARKRLSRTALETVDGLGADRVIDALVDDAGGS